MQPPFDLPLRGSRVHVRALRASDLPQFHRYRADPRIALYQDWLPMSEQEALEFLLRKSAAAGPVPGSWVQLGIALPATDLLAGDVGLYLDQNAEAAEIGFTLAGEHQGRGLATEAVELVLGAVFAGTPVTRVLGITDARNEASIRLLRRASFAKVSERPAETHGEACTEYIFERRRGAR